MLATCIKIPGFSTLVLNLGLPPVETHGCPIFHEGRWVGNVTTETEPNRSVVVPGEHRPLYVNKTDRGIGVGVVLASLGCAGVPAEQWPPEPQSDSDSDASENRPATPPPLNTPFERPRLPEPLLCSSAEGAIGLQRREGEGAEGQEREDLV